jgi:hypothetical protein
MEGLEKLHFGRAEAEKDVLRPIEHAASEGGVLKGLHLIFTRQYRIRICLALFTFSFIQLSGIDGVFYVCHADWKFRCGCIC